MISYYDGQLTDIMPGNITKKPEVKALSYALQQACRLLYRYSQRLYIYSNLDEQPEEVIDLLASELRTQYYMSTLDLDTKRRLVKNTLIWYMSAGTPEAVEELVSAVFGEGEVKEWYEYSDSPFYFKIVTNAILTLEMNDFFSIMIRRVKNTRSHLRAIDIHRIVNHELFSGAAVFQNYKPPAVIDGYAVDREARQTIYAGALASQQSRPAPIWDGFKTEGGEITAGVFVGAAGRSRTHQAAIVDGFTIQDETVTEAIVAATASNSKYKNTVKEGGTKNATTI